MIAVDTNILVYAHREDSPLHRQAYRSIEALAESRSDWAIPWPCLHEFYGVVTHPRIFDPSTTVDQAIDQIEAWLDCPNPQLIGESSRHWATLRSMLTAARMTGPRGHDARIAAICKQHGVAKLWSADRDFSAFPELLMPS